MEDKTSYEKNTLGWLREQAKKNGFDSIRDWQKNQQSQKPIRKKTHIKCYRQDIKNIDIVKNILIENNLEIKDSVIFYRFWERVDIKDNINDCWPWLAGKRNSFGYGQFWLYNKEKHELSHRIAFTLTKGEIPANLQVQHLCNNSGCCNPNHLVLGDQSDNMKYKSNCNRCNQSGANNNSSVLTEDKVFLIRKSYIKQRELHPEKFPIMELIAKEFGISKGAVSLIVRRKRWDNI